MCKIIKQILVVDKYNLSKYKKKFLYYDLINQGKRAIQTCLALSEIVICPQLKS